MDYIDLTVSILSSTIRLSVPLIFAALAGLFSERAGVFDIGLEGKMLGSAFAAGCVAYLTGSAWLGLGAGVLCSIALSIVHAFVSITNRGNQIISGVAVNFIVMGITIVLGQFWFGQGGRTPQVSDDARFLPIKLPGVNAAGGCACNRPTLCERYLRQQRSHLPRISCRSGLLVDTVPHPLWLATSRRGREPRRRRYGRRICCLAAISSNNLHRVLCGFAGAYLSIAQSASFVKDMSAGKGFIALAALVFAKWRPVPVMLACLLFGFLDAAANFMQGQKLPVVGEVPVQIFQALPYVLTCVLLAGFIGAARPPKAAGIPYSKER